MGRPGSGGSENPRFSRDRGNDSTDYSGRARTAGWLAFADGSDEDVGQVVLVHEPEARVEPQERRQGGFRRGDHDAGGGEVRVAVPTRQARPDAAEPLDPGVAVEVGATVD